MRIVDRHGSANASHLSHTVPAASVSTRSRSAERTGARLSSSGSAGSNARWTARAQRHLEVTEQIVPMVLEARGLDVTPMMIARFEPAGDIATARLLRRILTDEVRHVAAGVRRFG